MQILGVDAKTALADRVVLAEPVDSSRPSRAFTRSGLRRNMAPVLGKVGSLTHRHNGSAPEPRTSLAEERLALVERYMIDAEEAEARARAAAEKAAAQARSAAEGRAQREASSRQRIPGAAMPKRDTFLEVKEAPSRNGRPDADEEARTRKALAKAEKQAAKQAARRIAALEKREVRERKALAKAAARRRRG
jgi:hypothetical protein